MTVLLLPGLGGYLLGTVIALHLDRLLPDAQGCHAPLRRGDRHMSRLWWTGALGYIATRGRCTCGFALPARLWYLSLLSMVVAALVAQLAVGPSHAVLVAAFSVILVALVAIDIEQRLLSNRVMYPALALAVGACGLWPGRSVLDSLAGGLIGLAVMLAVFVTLPGFGFGDVKMAALLGLLSGRSHVASALLVSVLAGGVTALTLLIARWVGPGASIPYGPCLALGAFVGMFSR